MSRRNVLVLAEVFKDRVTELSREVLGAGRQLADSFGGQVIAVLLGQPSEGCRDQIGGADRVICLWDGKSVNLVAQNAVASLSEIVSEESVQAILVGSSSFGLDLGPLLAARLGQPVVMGCHGLEARDDVLFCTCRVFAGKLYAEVKVTQFPVICLILAGAFRPVSEPVCKEWEERKCTASSEPARVRFCAWIEPKGGDVDITQQDILVAVGRGIGQSENIALAEQLASALGGHLCGSRPVIDQGWLPHTRQVGKSGMIVKPKLYFALGISGAPEHVEGMKDAELIIAINRDENAPIFNVAHYGIVRDLFDVVPAITQALAARHQEA